MVVPAPLDMSPMWLPTGPPSFEISARLLVSFTIRIHTPHKSCRRPLHTVVNAFISYDGIEMTAQRSPETREKGILSHSWVTSWPMFCEASV